MKNYISGSEIGSGFGELAAHSHEEFPVVPPPPPGFFCSNFVGLFDEGGQTHNTVYALHRFMLAIY